LKLKAWIEGELGKREEYGERRDFEGNDG